MGRHYIALPAAEWRVMPWNAGRPAKLGREGPIPAPCNAAHSPPVPLTTGCDQRAKQEAGKPEAYRKAILDGLYQAMREALNVPEDD
jgi:hypothetical protein